MKNTMPISLLAVVLLSPAICFAHGMHPTQYALGPLPLCAAMDSDSWVLGLAIPIPVAIEVLALWVWVGKPGLMGHLWRASILYIVAKIAETVILVYMMLGLLPQWVAPAGALSSGEIFGSLSLCLIAGMLLKLATAYLLYGKNNLSRGRIIGAVSTATIAGYFATLGWIRLVTTFLD